MNIYSDIQKANDRILICKRCVYSNCNGNNVQKCDTSTLTCGINGQRIASYAQRMSNTCPKGRWEQKNALGQIMGGGDGCGCGS